MSWNEQKRLIINRLGIGEVENLKLAKALKKLTVREYFVFLVRTVDNMPWSELEYLHTPVYSEGMRESRVTLKQLKKAEVNAELKLKAELSAGLDI